MYLALDQMKGRWIVMMITGSLSFGNKVRISAPNWAVVADYKYPRGNQNDQVFP
jgi:hypothetical protein